MLTVVPASWAEHALAAQSPAAKPVASKKMRAVNKPVQPARPKLRSVVQPDSEVGPAEVLVSDTQGLHGQASFYGKGFSGRKTANGDRFDVKLFTGASNHFPLGSKVAVRRLDNDRCAIVKVNDRMHAKHRRRVIDVSLGVAEYLGMVRAGVVLVRVAALKAGAGDSGQSDCHAAFDSENECPSCDHRDNSWPQGQPPKLPDFGDVFSRQN
ncbi:MAG TPA: septal ring lytic transglycosylase RlpA family protein [Azonexus sp.]|nr:septal ring lytic transglycosylase RlpA family protein [Azonexus sp.]